MQIYLIRHADAEPVGAAGVQTDEERPLTAKGMEQTDDLARFFKRLGVEPGVILSSPLLRSRQTAERLLERMGLGEGKCELVLEDELALGGSCKKLAKRLAKVNSAVVFLVGHEPDLGRFTGWLIGSKRAHIEFAKAGVACLEARTPIEKGCASLIWLVTPTLQSR
ncbi:MAG: phosphohistidine phosphatase SixA [Gemmatales bacterium]|nr:phosphohistidine phosphatase SixA [Gemmatales bacterium]MDW8387775.1 phosphohistidine phosphatase SixA [Gemmatales bacterium]